MWHQVVPVIDARMPALCRKAYPGHTHGCPNYGCKHGCPPTCKPISRQIDLGEPVWAIWTVFDLGAHAARMRGLHPDWSDRQLRCCLYWQPGARRNLRVALKQFLIAVPGLCVVMTPEGAGVNVTETMARIGETLQWPPVDRTYQIALAGRPAPERAG